MIENDAKFQSSANELVCNVTDDTFKYLINMFMDDAAINMGCDVPDETLERTIYHIRKDFGYLPVNYIVSAFIRGSLGKLGAGRLVPKTIHSWLDDVAAEYNRMQVHEKQKANQSDVSIAMDLHKKPIGKAIIQKINWYKEGRLDGDRWDRVDLHALATAIGNKEHITFEKYFK